VGLYQVGTNILVGYIGLVFVAMSNDYYPRLCNYENDSKKFNTLVNDQTELALLLVVPAVLILYTIAPFLVSLLYTNEFINVLDLLKIGLLSIVFKAIVWPIGFIPLIKGNKLLFLKQNVLGDGLNIVFSILLFKIMGLAGLGLAMVIMFVVQKYYEFRFRKETLKLMCFSILICTIPVVIFFVTEFENFNGYITVIAIAALLNSLYQLKTKIKS
jgi:O-antigen/teichoic acid export membrane protein